MDRLPFPAIVGQEDLKSALLLNAVNRDIGGVLIRGERGTGVCRSMAADADGEYVSLADVPPGNRTRIVTRMIESVR